MWTSVWILLVVVAILYVLYSRFASVFLARLLSRWFQYSVEIERLGFASILGISISPVRIEYGPFVYEFRILVECVALRIPILEFIFSGFRSKLFRLSIHGVEVECVVVRSTSVREEGSSPSLRSPQPSSPLSARFSASEDGRPPMEKSAAYSRHYRSKGSSKSGIRQQHRNMYSGGSSSSYRSPSSNVTRRVRSNTIATGTQDLRDRSPSTLSQLAPPVSAPPTETRVRALWREMFRIVIDWCFSTGISLGMVDLVDASILVRLKDGDHAFGVSLSRVSVTPGSRWEISDSRIHRLPCSCSISRFRITLFPNHGSSQSSSVEREKREGEYRFLHGVVSRLFNSSLSTWNDERFDVIDVGAVNVTFFALYNSLNLATKRFGVDEARFYCDAVNMIFSLQLFEDIFGSFLLSLWNCRKGNIENDSGDESSSSISSTPSSAAVSEANRLSQINSFSFGISRISICCTHNFRDSVLCSSVLPSVLDKPVESDILLSEAPSFSASVPIDCIAFFLSGIEILGNRQTHQNQIIHPAMTSFWNFNGRLHRWELQTVHEGRFTLGKPCTVLSGNSMSLSYRLDDLTEELDDTIHQRVILDIDHGLSIFRFSEMELVVLREMICAFADVSSSFLQQYRAQPTPKIQYQSLVDSGEESLLLELYATTYVNDPFVENSKKLSSIDVRVKISEFEVIVNEMDVPESQSPRKTPRESFLSVRELSISVSDNSVHFSLDHVDLDSNLVADRSQSDSRCHRVEHPVFGVLPETRLFSANSIAGVFPLGSSRSVVSDGKPAENDGSEILEMDDLVSMVIDRLESEDDSTILKDDLDADGLRRKMDGGKYDNSTLNSHGFRSFGGDYSTTDRNDILKRVIPLEVDSLFVAFYGQISSTLRFVHRVGFEFFHSLSKSIKSSIHQVGKNFPQYDSSPFSMGLAERSLDNPVIPYSISSLLFRSSVKQTTVLLPSFSDESTICLSCESISLDYIREFLSVQNQGLDRSEFIQAASAQSSSSKCDESDSDSTSSLIENEYAHSDEEIYDFIYPVDTISGPIASTVSQATLKELSRLFPRSALKISCASVSWSICLPECVEDLGVVENLEFFRLEEADTRLQLIWLTGSTFTWGLWPQLSFEEWLFWFKNSFHDQGKEFVISQIRSAPTESTKENPSRTPSLSSKWVVAGSVCHIVIPISRASVIDFECSRFFVGRGLEVSLLPPVDLNAVSSSMDFVFHSCRSRIEGALVGTAKKFGFRIDRPLPTESSRSKNDPGPRLSYSRDTAFSSMHTFVATNLSMSPLFPDRCSKCYSIFVESSHLSIPVNSTLGTFLDDLDCFDMVLTFLEMRRFRDPNWNGLSSFVPWRGAPQNIQPQTWLIELQNGTPYADIDLKARIRPCYRFCSKNMRIEIPETNLNRAILLQRSLLESNWRNWSERKLLLEDEMRLRNFPEALRNRMREKCEMMHGETLFQRLKSMHERSSGAATLLFISVGEVIGDFSPMGSRLTDYLDKLRQIALLDSSPLSCRPYQHNADLRPFQSLKGITVSLSISDLLVRYHDLSDPVLKSAGMSISGSILSSKMKPSNSSFTLRNILIPGPASLSDSCTFGSTLDNSGALDRSCRLFSIITPVAPLRVFTNIHIHFDEFFMAHSPLHIGFNRDVSRVFSILSPPSLELCCPLAWWDDMRLRMHGHINFSFDRFRIKFLCGPRVYDSGHCLLMDACTASFKYHHCYSHQATSPSETEMRDANTTLRGKEESCISTKAASFSNNQDAMLEDDDLSSSDLHLLRRRLTFSGDCSVDSSLSSLFKDDRILGHSRWSFSERTISPSDHIDMWNNEVTESKPVEVFREGSDIFMECEEYQSSDAMRITKTNIDDTPTIPDCPMVVEAEWSFLRLSRIQPKLHSQRTFVEIPKQKIQFIARFLSTGLLQKDRSYAYHYVEPMIYIPPSLRTDSSRIIQLWKSSVLRYQDVMNRRGFDSLDPFHSDAPILEIDEAEDQLLEWIETCALDSLSVEELSHSLLCIPDLGFMVSKPLCPFSLIDLFACRLDPYKNFRAFSYELSISSWSDTNSSDLLCRAPDPTIRIDPQTFTWFLKVADLYSSPPTVYRPPSRTHGQPLLHTMSSTSFLDELTLHLYSPMLNIAWMIVLEEQHIIHSSLADLELQIRMRSPELDSFLQVLFSSQAASLFSKLSPTLSDRESIGKLDLMSFNFSGGVIESILHIPETLVQEMIADGVEGVDEVPQLEFLLHTTGDPLFSLQEWRIQTSQLTVPALFQRVPNSEYNMSSPLSIPRVHVDIMLFSLRLFWDSRTRDAIYNALDLYDQYRVLKQYFTGAVGSKLNPTMSVKDTSSASESIESDSVLNPVPLDYYSSGEREHRNLSSSPSGTSLDEIEENDDSSFEDMSDDDDANVEKKEFAIGDDETILALAGAPSDSDSTDRICVATLQLVRPNLFLQREIGESGCVLLKSEYTILNSYWRNSGSLQFLQRNLEDAPYLNTLLGQPQSRCRNIDHDINIRCEGLETFVSSGHVDIDEIWTQYHLSDLQSTEVDEEDDVRIVVSEPAVDSALEDVHTHSVSSAGRSGSSSASLSGSKEEKLAVKEKSLDRGSKPPSHVSPLLSAGSPSSITLTIVEWIEERVIPGSMDTAKSGSEPASSLNVAFAFSPPQPLTEDSMFEDSRNSISGKNDVQFFRRRRVDFRSDSLIFRTSPSQWNTLLDVLTHVLVEPIQRRVRLEDEIDTLFFTRVLGLTGIPAGNDSVQSVARGDLSDLSNDVSFPNSSGFMTEMDRLSRQIKGIQSRARATQLEIDRITCSPSSTESHPASLSDPVEAETRRQDSHLAYLERDLEQDKSRMRDLKSRLRAYLMSQRFGSKTEIESEAEIEFLVRLQSASWLLTDESSRSPFVDLSMEEVSVKGERKPSKNSEFEIKVFRLQARNLLPNAFYENVLLPQMTERSGMPTKHGMVRVFIRQRPPVNRIPVYEHLEFDLVPLKIQLTYELFLRCWQFFFPDDARSLSIQSSRRRDSISHVAHPGYRSQRPLLITFMHSEEIRSYQMQNGLIYKSDSCQNSDVLSSFDHVRFRSAEDMFYLSSDEIVKRLQALLSPRMKLRTKSSELQSPLQERKSKKSSSGDWSFTDWNSFSECVSPLRIRTFPRFDSVGVFSMHGRSKSARSSSDRKNKPPLGKSFSSSSAPASNMAKRMKRRSTVYERSLRQKNTPASAIEILKDRAKLNKTFEYVKVQDTKINLSFKGLKEKDFKDFENVRVKLRAKAYHGFSGSFKDLGEVMKKDILSDLRPQILMKVAKKKMTSFFGVASSNELDEGPATFEEKLRREKIDIHGGLGEQQVKSVFVTGEQEASRHRNELAMEVLGDVALSSLYEDLQSAEEMVDESCSDNLPSTSSEIRSPVSIRLPPIPVPLDDSDDEDLLPPTAEFLESLRQKALRSNSFSSSENTR